MTKEIPNEDLLIDLFPDPYGDSSAFVLTWYKFALTINGHEIYGGLQACGDVSQQVHLDSSKATLTELRCALFFKHDSELPQTCIKH